MNLDVTTKEYLNQKGIEFREHGNELIIACPFNNCDADSRPNEAHCYITADTGLYDCKKCGEQGNLITLAKHLGDKIKHGDTKAPSKATPQLEPGLIEKCHKALPDSIRRYLNGRLITDELIDDYQLGYGKFYGRNWITIPIADERGEWSFLKLRQDPQDADNPDKYKFYPMGSSAAIFNLQALQGNEDLIVICEGEFDSLVLQSQGIQAITSTAGAGTFKQEWLDELSSVQKIYLCLDKDEAGQQGTERLTQKLSAKFPDTTIYAIGLPERMTDGKDITDYFLSYDGNPDELMLELPKLVAGPEPINTSHFETLSVAQLTQILGLTIKQDEENKAVTFLAQLTAYTENCQFNISFNAPSSTGKSYIPTEIARLFPSVDVKEIGYCSPTAFFHDVGKYDKEREGYIVDLSRKILIFLDQPHTLLLQHLRPLLSHDQKEISLKITDKTQKYGLKTKTVLLRGYPAVIFCTAGLRLDEQEATRFLLLSPEVNQDKIRQGISATILREADNDSFKAWLEADPDRKLLKERIRAIKQEGIQEIKLTDYTEIERRFLASRPILKPRHQRDIKRLIALIKACALLNLWWREHSGTTITANHEDVEEAFRIWDKISVSQELNIPPYLYNLYQEIIIAAWRDKNSGHTLDVSISVGLTRQDILQKHIAVHGRPLDTIQLRQQILPMLEAVGLITQEEDPMDKRRKLVYPTTLLDPQNNRESPGGVNDESEMEVPMDELVSE
jgi:5S rRNA maturation endonuclease (ribonuclease M5)